MIYSRKTSAITAEERQKNADFLTRYNKVRSSFDAVTDGFDGSKISYKNLFNVLSAIEELAYDYPNYNHPFLEAIAKYAEKPEYDIRFGGQLRKLFPLMKEVTSEFYRQITSLDSFNFAASGIEVIYCDNNILGRTSHNNKKEVKLYYSPVLTDFVPKLSWTLEELSNIGIYLDDMVVISSGKLHDVKYSSYQLIDIPKINMQIAVSNYVGNPVFVSNKIYNVGVWSSYTYEDVDEHVSGITKINSNNRAEFISILNNVLSSTLSKHPSEYAELSTVEYAEKYIVLDKTISKDAAFDYAYRYFLENGKWPNEIDVNAKNDNYKYWSIWFNNIPLEDRISANIEMFDKMVYSEAAAYYDLMHSPPLDNLDDYIPSSNKIKWCHIRDIYKNFGCDGDEKLDFYCVSKKNFNLEDIHDIIINNIARNKSLPVVSKDKIGELGDVTWNYLSRHITDNKKKFNNRNIHDIARELILNLVEQYRLLNGDFPNSESGKVENFSNLSWSDVEHAIIDMNYFSIKHFYMLHGKNIHDIELEDKDIIAGTLHFISKKRKVPICYVEEIDGRKIFGKLRSVRVLGRKSEDLKPFNNWYANYIKNQLKLFLDEHGTYEDINEYSMPSHSNIAWTDINIACSASEISFQGLKRAAFNSKYAIKEEKYDDIILVELKVRKKFPSTGRNDSLILYPYLNVRQIDHEISSNKEILGASGLSEFIDNMVIRFAKEYKDKYGIYPYEDAGAVEGHEYISWEDIGKGWNSKIYISLEDFYYKNGLIKEKSEIDLKRAEQIIIDHIIKYEEIPKASKKLIPNMGNMSFGALDKLLMRNGLGSLFYVTQNMVGRLLENSSENIKDEDYVENGSPLKWGTLKAAIEKRRGKLCSEFKKVIAIGNADIDIINDEETLRQCVINFFVKNSYFPSANKFKISENSRRTFSSVDKEIKSNPDKYKASNLSCYIDRLVLSLVEEHKNIFGVYPDKNSGSIHLIRDRSWEDIDNALKRRKQIGLEHFLRKNNYIDNPKDKSPMNMI